MHAYTGTTTMSKMNPGYADQSKKPFDPPLTGNPNPGLVDFIVKERCELHLLSAVLSAVLSTVCCL